MRRFRPQFKTLKSRICQVLLFWFIYIHHKQTRQSLSYTAARACLSVVGLSKEYGDVLCTGNDIEACSRLSGGAI